MEPVVVPATSWLLKQDTLFLHVVFTCSYQDRKVLILAVNSMLSSTTWRMERISRSTLTGMAWRVSLTGGNSRWYRLFYVLRTNSACEEFYSIKSLNYNLITSIETMWQSISSLLSRQSDLWSHLWSISTHRPLEQVYSRSLHCKCRRSVR